MAERGDGLHRDLSGGLVLAALLIAPAIAAADGERTPMVAGTVVGAAAHERPLARVAVDAAWWHWRFGLAAEGAMRWSGDDVDGRVLDARPLPDVTRQGVGIALRLRGGGESDLWSRLAEARGFVRLLAAPMIEDPTLARITTPPKDRDTGQVMIVVGLGAVFGTGDPGYLERFRTEPFSPSARRRAGGWFER